MSYADLVLTLLDRQQLRYRTIKAPETVTLQEDWLEQTVPVQSIARLAVLQDQNGIVLAFYPASHSLNLQQLQSALHRKLSFCDTESIANRLAVDLKNDSFDIKGENGWQIIIDDNLTNQDYVHLEATGTYRIIRLKSDDFQTITGDALLGSSFCSPRRHRYTSKKNEEARPSIRERISKLGRLPALPVMPARILALHNNPESTVNDLVNLIETDLFLSAQVIRYANSTMFATDKPIISLKDAIFRVLGYETVLHMSLGYALGRTFKLPVSGPLGQEKFWEHAVYSATLMHRLSLAIPQNARPKPGMAYLSGLLHDIGFLVLNLFFRDEHAWLNKLLQNSPEKSVATIETQLLGISHTELGAGLMKHWSMPVEMITAIEHHHNLTYNGTGANYSQLMNLTERLMKMHNMSDADTDEIPDSLLEKLHLNEENVFLIMDEVLQGGNTIKAMANTIGR